MSSPDRPDGPAQPTPAPIERTDQRRLDQEIARYRDCENVHDLPAIFHYWSERYLLPKLRAWGFAGLDDFFLFYLVETCRLDPRRVHTLASLGAGNCDLEIRLATQAIGRGVNNFRFHCVELNPQMVERGRRLAQQERVADHFSFEVADVDSWQPTEPLSVCLANHSLHHLVELERLFGSIYDALGGEGIFLINDMVGRNGHLRWPEALAVVTDLWRLLPERYKYNHQLRRLELEFDDWDCAQEGNEGIRAQDVLPLLVERFQFDTFLGFGNVIDIFVDRSFGHNFDPAVAEDAAWVDFVARLDERLIDAGEIKPTHVIAALRTRHAKPVRCFRHWTPTFCVRSPDLVLAPEDGDLPAWGA